MTTEFDTSEDIADEPELDPVDVREKTGLEPAEMAELLGMRTKGYLAWEAGHRTPGGPAWQLLALIDADPKGMTDRLEAL